MASFGVLPGPSIQRLAHGVHQSMDGMLRTSQQALYSQLKHAYMAPAAQRLGQGAGIKEQVQADNRRKRCRN